MAPIRPDRPLSSCAPRVSGAISGSAAGASAAGAAGAAGAAAGRPRAAAPQGPDAGAGAGAGAEAGAGAAAGVRRPARCGGGGLASAPRPRALGRSRRGSRGAAAPAAAATEPSPAVPGLGPAGRRQGFQGAEELGPPGLVLQQRGQPVDVGRIQAADRPCWPGLVASRLAPAGQDRPGRRAGAAGREGCETGSWLPAATPSPAGVKRRGARPAARDCNFPPCV